MDFLRPIAAAVVLCSSLATLSGCRLCGDCDLDAYPSYGGAWQRTLRDSGRVGSLFDPGGSRASDLSARVDAESMEQEIRNRNSAGGSNEDATDRETDDAADPLKDQGDVRDRNFDNDQQLKDMEDRLRDLDLQDINYRHPGDDSQDWR